MFLGKLKLIKKILMNIFGLLIEILLDLIPITKSNTIYCETNRFFHNSTREKKFYHRKEVICLRNWRGHKAV